MKIFLFGPNGQIGSALLSELKAEHKVITFSRRTVDVSDPNALRDIFNTEEPKVIINAAAYTDVEKAETEKKLVQSINAESVKIMANYCYRMSCLLVHFSTDYVFDGKKATAYLETDKPKPLNFYGRSKLCGEKYIQDSGCRNIILRLSWVMSSSHPCFLSNIFQRAKSNQEIRVVDDQFGAPTSGRFVASVVKKILSNPARIETGIYHLSCGGKTSWFNYANFIIDKIRERDIDKGFDYAKLIPVSSDDFALEAERPKNSELNCDKLFSKIDQNRNHWKDEVSQELFRMTNDH